MPKEYLKLLPRDKEQFLVKNYKEYYPDDYEFCWAFCRYFWESHPMLPDIPLLLLEQWDRQFTMNSSK
jgi:hypothetical protein